MLLKPSFMVAATIATAGFMVPSASAQSTKIGFSPEDRAMMEKMFDRGAAAYIGMGALSILFAESGKSVVSASDWKAVLMASCENRFGPFSWTNEECQKAAKRYLEDLAKRDERYAVALTSLGSSNPEQKAFGFEILRSEDPAIEAAIQSVENCPSKQLTIFGCQVRPKVRSQEQQVLDARATGSVTLPPAAPK